MVILLKKKIRDVEGFESHRVCIPIEHLRIIDKLC